MQRQRGTNLLVDPDEDDPPTPATPRPTPPKPTLKPRPASWSRFVAECEAEEAAQAAARAVEDQNADEVILAPAPAPTAQAATPPEAPLPAVYLNLPPERRAAVDEAMARVARVIDDERWAKRLAKVTDRAVLVSLAVARVGNSKRLRDRWGWYVYKFRPHLRGVDPAAVDLADSAWNAVQPRLMVDPETGCLVPAPQPKPKKGPPAGVEPKAKKGAAAPTTATSAPTHKPTVTAAGKLSDPPPELYMPEYRNEPVLAVKWARKAVVALIGDGRAEAVGNLHMVMGQLVYWSKPTDDKGRPRDPEDDKYLKRVDGLTWVRVSPETLADAVDMPYGQVRNTLARLQALGVIERLPKERVVGLPCREGEKSYGPNTTLLRINWEVAWETVQGMRLHRPKPSRQSK
jgi:hypothetical protein